jgi:hypothetical protein
MLVCDKCFTKLPESAVFCLECGAPVKCDNPDNVALEGSDREVYAELTNANLLRMRGQWAEAENRCIGILRRFPNNATTHTLLGDICRDQGRIDDSIEWYQMALDLNPNGVGERVKLEDLQQRKNEREEARVANTQYQPNTPPPKWAYALLGIIGVLIVLVVFLSIMLMRKQPTTAPVGPPIIAKPSAPIITPTPVPIQNQPPTELNNIPPHNPPRLQPAIAVTVLEQRFFNSLSQRNPELANRITNVTIDPRSLNITVSFKLESGAFNRERIMQDAIHIAQGIFNAVSDASSLTLRALGPIATGSLDVVFQGDCQKDAALHATEPITPESSVQVLTNIYWPNPLP